MSETEPTTTYEPVWLKHRANIVEAIRYDGTEHCRRAIIDWVAGHSGEAYDDYSGNLWIHTPQQRHAVEVGQWVLRGVSNEFYNPNASDVEVNYDRVPGPDRGATLTRDQAAAIVVAADHIGDTIRAGGRGGPSELEIRELVDTLVESVHQLATALEAER